jgi:hypothetical protein
MTDVELYRFIEYNKFVRFRDMVIAVFSRSRKVQQLDEDRRRALGNAIFNAESQEALHEIALKALASSVVFDEDSKMKVANDIFDRRYDSLLLPDRFDCDEGAGTGTAPAATADQTASALDSTPEEDSYVQGGGSKLAPKGNSDSGNADEDDNDGDNSNENEECPVCLGTNDVVCITKCNHVFCRECIIGWVGLNHSCPMCRTSLAPEIDVSFL